METPPAPSRVSPLRPPREGTGGTDLFFDGEGLEEVRIFDEAAEVSMHSVQREIPF